jgi:formate hydrogenlyase subunit 6/NADH:ubiquinone oxidoreductase subunit I
MEAKEESYWGNIVTTAQSLWTGMRITLQHLWDARKSQRPTLVSEKNYFSQPNGIVTIQYPYEMQPIPDNGRYRLHNEIDDCIVCDKCAKVCPVNCIEIEPIKATEEIGKTSDGTSKRIYAAKFDIDMSKCCFCGLCTTVCPTECLTMTKVFDYSVYDVREHQFAFSEMSQNDIAEKKAELQQHQQAKELAKAPMPTSSEATAPTTPTSVEQPTAPKVGAKPVFKPKIKPAGPPPTS